MIDFLKFDQEALRQAMGIAVPGALEPPSVGMINAERKRIVRQILSRKFEGINLYKELPISKLFHACNAEKRIVTGSNRSSKTFSVAAEATRAWVNCDPFGKYRPSNGNSIFVGLDLDHCAMFWRKCSQPGQFRIIPDEHTGMWRAVRPDPNDPLHLDPYDLAYSERWKDAPPLISNRTIKSIAWEDRGKGIPRYATFKTNWRCLFRSSDGKAAKGDAFDLAVFDEEQASLEWYYEIVRGLVGQHVQSGWHPKMIWSATSHVANIELANLRDRAAAGDLGVAQFDMLLKDNPYFTDEAKSEFEASLPENERLTRIHGIPAMTVRRIYPTYNPMVDVEDGGHGCEPFEVDPAKYSRYAIIDPGISHCTTLFVLVDEQEKHVTVYDGFQLSSATATRWAEEMKLRENGRPFEAMVIDARMGEQSPMVQHKTTVAQEYWKSIQNVGCIPRQRGPFYGFYPSNNNVEARCECLRSWMEIRGDGPFAGTSVLRVMRGMVPKLDREIRMAATDPKNDKKRMKLAKVPCDNLDCFDVETEVLTKEGWKYFKDITLDNHLATVDLPTDSIQYQKPTRLIDKAYSGEVFVFGGNKLDAVVTPNHRMLSYRTEWNSVKNQYTIQDGQLPVFVAAQDLHKDRDRLKVSASWLANDNGPILIDRVSGGYGLQKELDPGTFAEFLGWYVAEGSIDSNPKCPGSGYRVCISQITPYKRALLKTLLDQLPWHWIEERHGYTASDKQLWTYLQPLGNKYNKYVHAWVKQASAATIRRFLIGAVLGDGTIQNNGGRQYYTTSKQLANDIQELFIKCGMSASVLNKKQGLCKIRGGCYETKPLYIVSEWQRKIASLSNHSREPNFHSTLYDGRVYCATVESGTLIVRRNGRPLIAGNCLEYAASFKPRYHTPGVKIVEDESEALEKYKSWMKNHNRREARETTGVSMYQ